MQVLVKDLRAALKAFAPTRAWQFITLGPPPGQLYPGLALTSHNYKDGLSFTMYVNARHSEFQPTSVRLDDLRDAIQRAPATAVVTLVPAQGGLRISVGSGETLHETEIDTYKFTNAPIPRPGHDAILSISDMIRVLNEVSFCVDHLHYRLALRGVRIELRQRAIVFTATDAHCLVRLQLTKDTVKNEKVFTAPIKALRLLENLDYYRLDIHANDKEAFFFANNFVLKTALIEEEFPDTSSLFTYRDQVYAEMPIAPLLGIVGVGAAAAGRAGARIEMQFGENTCAVIAKNSQNEEISKDFVEFRGDAAHKVLFNAEKFLFLLGHMQGHYVRMSFSADRPSVAHVRLRGDEEGYTAILMPLLSN